MMLPCDSITPFGRPDVPEVKQIVASVALGQRAERPARACSGGQQRCDRGQAVCRRPGARHTCGGNGEPLLRETRARHARAFDDEASRFGMADAPRDVFRIVIDVQRDDDQAQAQRREIDARSSRRRFARTARRDRPRPAPAP